MATVPYKHGSFSSFPKEAQQYREINVDRHKKADLGAGTTEHSMSGVELKCNTLWRQGLTQLSRKY